MDIATSGINFKHIKENHFVSFTSHEKRFATKHLVLYNYSLTPQFFVFFLFLFLFQN